ncbi:MAG: hypothetical protein IKA36_00345 [Clostridia bacterium]|nr:hypothetical protein [Clostridia bacterium]
MKKLRMYRSCLTTKLIEKYNKASKLVDPNLYNRRISNCSTDELVKKGVYLMKKDGFKIATDEVVKGL